MDFQDPVPLSATGIRHPHAIVVLGMNVERDLVACNFLVWEYAYQMSGNWAAVLPARLFRQLAGILMQFRSGDIDALLKVLLASRESLFYVTAQLLFHGIAANDVRSAKVRFQLFEDGAKVEEHNVILCDSQVRRILIIRRQSVSPGAHNALVLIAGDPVHTASKRVDALIDLAFFGARPNQALR